MHQMITRAAATEAGLTNYFTGKPCHRGHVALRNVKGKQCLECRALAITDHRARFSEEEWTAKERVRCNDYNDHNRTARRASARKFMARLYKQDPKRFSKRSHARERKLLLDNPLVLRLSQAARRAAYRVRQGGLVSPRGLTAIVRRVWDKCGGKCAVCTSTKRLELDHILALANGGANDEGNLQFLCGSCNKSKNDTDFHEWLASRSAVEGLAA